MEKLNLTPVLNLQRKDKNGNYAIRIRQTVKGKVTYYPTGFAVSEDQFENKEVIRHPTKVLLNLAIRKQMNEIEQSYLEDDLQIKRLTDFHAYGAAIVKKQKVRNTGTTNTRKNSQLNKIKEFRPTLSFSDITPTFMNEYEAYMKSRGNADTTIWGGVKFIKLIINSALEDGVIKHNPLKSYRAPQYKGPARAYLTEDDLEALEKFVRESQVEKLVKVANWFLFGCYTGLRYSDVRDFKRSSIVGDRIILRTTKTQSDVSIKIHPKLTAVLKRISPNVISNTKMNDYLKLIGERLEINKTLSFHLARHTFAVYFLNKGGSMETLGKLLGHTKLSTTAIYGKITNMRIDAEMDKVWAQ